MDTRRPWCLGVAGGLRYYPFFALLCQVHTKLATVLPADHADAERDAKRAKRALLASHKDKAKALKYAKAFAGEGLVERDEKLFCTFCNRFVPFDRKAATRQHCEGKRVAGVSFASLSEEQKMTLKHYQNKVNAQQEAEKKNALQRAMERQLKLLFEADNSPAPLRQGATLPAEMQADRLLVLETLWRAGVALNTLRNANFLKLVEEPHLALGGVDGVRALVPVVQQREAEAVKAALNGRRIALFIDGTKANFLIEGVVVRFLDDNLMPHQQCVGVSAIKRSLNTDMLVALLRKHITDVGVPFSHIVGIMSDSGQPNPAAIAKWNATARETGLVDETLLWLPCLMHAASNVGKTLRKQLPAVKNFMSGFKTMSNESEAARLLWADTTGHTCKQLSDKSFWRWWKCIKAVLKVKQHVAAFLRDAGGRKLSKKSIAKMAEAWQDPLLVAKMEFCIAAGQVFRDMSQFLEGDGFCMPFVQKHIRLVETYYATWPRANRASADQHHLIASIINRLRESRPRDAAVDALAGKLYDAGGAVAVHADSAILRDMAAVLPLYRACGLFHPLQFLTEAEREGFQAYLIKAIELLASLKGIAQSAAYMLSVELNGQVLTYQQLCRDRARHLQANPKEDTAPQLWNWWLSIRAGVPAWFSVAEVLVLLQPTSGAIERFFSLVKANTSALQNREAPEVFATRCMCLYNHSDQ